MPAHDILSPFIYHSEWLIVLTPILWAGLLTEQAAQTPSSLQQLAPPYHPNTPTCLWKSVIEWVYVVKLINHINLYLLVGWLKAMTIRLMKLVNSSYPRHTPNYEERGEKGIQRETVMTKLAIKIWLLIECLVFFINDELYKKTLRREY